MSNAGRPYDYPVITHDELVALQAFRGYPFSCNDIGYPLNAYEGVPSTFVQLRLNKILDNAKWHLMSE